MSAAQIETETQWLRDTIVPQLVANGYFATNGEVTCDAKKFQIRDIQIKLIGVEEAFMLTSCYRAVIDYEYAGSCGVHAMVVKKTPKVPQETYDSINFDALFGNEIHAYKEIMPAIDEFAGKKFKIPKFLYGDQRTDFATIALDDFSIDGWRVAKEKTDLSLEHVLVAVDYLADLHGTAFALRHDEPDKFEALVGQLRESRYANSVVLPDFMMLMRTSVLRMMQVTREHEKDVPQQFIDKLGKLLKEPWKLGKHMVQPKEPMITLCHGDYLRNNVAYKYGKGEDADTPLDILMFDLQTMRMGSPMIDLCIFLNLSAFARVRFSHFKQIFGAYSTKLAVVYKKLTKTALPDFLSETSLMKEYIRFLPYSLAICMCFLPMLVQPTDITSEERLTQQRTEAEVVEEAMTNGGDTVNTELAHQVKELYELSLQYGVNVFESPSV